MNTNARDFLLTRLEEDLLGPIDTDEVIQDRPSDRYLTGMLYPNKLPYAPEQNELLEVEGSTEIDTNSTTEDIIPSSKIVRPSSAGLSFAVDPNKGIPEINIQVHCGTYINNSNKKEISWQRIDHLINIDNFKITDKSHRISLKDYDIKGLNLYIQLTQWGDYYLITVALVNTHNLPVTSKRDEIDEATFFQTSLKITAAGSSLLIARPSKNINDTDNLDYDDAVSRLIYRNMKEFAVGHTCSAGWVLDNSNTFAESIYTTWIPKTIVKSTNSEGDDLFKKLINSSENPLSSSWLSSSKGKVLATGLRKLTNTYEEWIEQQTARIESLPCELQNQAKRHMEDCKLGLDRMNNSIDLLYKNKEAENAFRLANKAMLIQRRWAFPETADLIWRPFQLGFLLLSLTSVAIKEHPDREVMDLIWFPTGGGKTEAYLALSAFTLFYRRIRYKGSDKGSGISILMRYTLRLLTTQQFQRAASLICACELLRSTASQRPLGTTKLNLGGSTFSIGLWVGEGSTPNRFENIDSGETKGTYKQLTQCPCCHSKLIWNVISSKKAVHVSCKNSHCDLSKLKTLPVWTVDTDIYRKKPSLIIGTIDKFAQIVRKKETGVLFGINTQHDAPDLIIQDELHLISGPLGTMAACYEIAIDELCTRENHRPKVIGSTATIRRASEQIRALFNRETYQFPAPGIDFDNSGFAVLDDESPGRLYIGLTTAGKSAKFSLQATCATLLQGANNDSLSDNERDPYWTLVAYFNSLRELGGALVLMQDDVPASMEEYSKRHNNEDIREIYEITELTSRIDSSKIPEILSELENKYNSDEAHDILLASNMISVGVDISRLGLMIVNGQPKGMAEYIQATSRVGRGKIPGLVVTLYNSAKTRDRSHFEAFSTWHNTLYRDVEASSVTPFASRARDRTLHGILVALVRHLIPTLQDSPKLSDESRARVKELFSVITKRAKQIDPDEISGINEFLSEFVDEWDRKNPVSYWNDWKPKQSLLISAETEAEKKAAGYTSGARPVQNSLRTVEPSTNFYLVEKLKGEESKNAS